ncbi:hypothetical protein [Actinomadura madurae]|uniref:hypothetical protein n=1 Tax=Actinomadura madurae TaxID=1993 RepID=UPI0020D23406|nr:hypothetical protein [Actinomadura madurae]MCP9948660.1 hypothetical protein [Actinomadura madurae]MCP9965432.1 hypothetical protein [Actinomadura madurae]MCP9977923.1 hypothetical protein [Actinomadura madurae]MCQ0010576.1 hypothetical protein [Actinomadura madurae]MCQ0014113.1 hypothetical protein [Actinomadura madurae]
MPVTDEQIATLRAQLRGNIVEHRRLLKQLDADEANVGYPALIAAAFITAVQQRFIKDGQPADRSEVVDFVSRARAKHDEAPDVISPEIAERMILRLLGKGPMIEIDEESKLAHQIILLAALISQENFTEPELDAFLVKARAIADDFLG